MVAKYHSLDVRFREKLLTISSSNKRILLIFPTSESKIEFGIVSFANFVEGSMNIAAVFTLDKSGTDAMYKTKLVP